MTDSDRPYETPVPPPLPAPATTPSHPTAPGSAGGEHVTGEAGHVLAAGDSGRAPTASIDPTDLPPQLSMRRRQRTRRRVPAEVATRQHFSARERLLILDTWQRSKLPAKDFASLVGISQHSLYKWRSRFLEEGPAGLEDRAKGPGPGSRLSEETKRAILIDRKSVV